VKRWIWEEVICRFGAPEEVITDNGKEFMGNFAALMASCDTTHITTSTHHPQANGMVERMNQTLKGAIKRDSAMADTAWDERMPLALLALRASSHAATKMAPSEVLLGHRIRMPVVGEAPTGQM
jgi:transposase InsO family protein